MRKLTEIQCRNAKPREKAYKMFDDHFIHIEDGCYFYFLSGKIKQK